MNIENTLTAHKNMIKIKKFKRLMIFKIINVVFTTTLRRERFEIIIHKVKVKNIF